MRALLTAGLILAAVEFAPAQTYPTRPIAMVAPAIAGGATDTLARVLAEPMRAVLGQTIVIENVTGAGGTLSIARVARAAPDGYTLSIGQSNSHVFSSISYAVSYDVLKDLEPIALLTVAPMVLVARAGLPPKDMSEFISWLKANPNKVSFGSVGAGGPSRVWGAQFQANTGTQIQFVPYRGAFAIVQDLVAGQIDLACIEGSNVAAHLGGGKIKLYAIVSDKRWALAPEVPTIAETGAPAFAMPFWHGLWGPKGTPKDVVAKLNMAAAQALEDPAVRARLAQAGQDPFPPGQLSPQALYAYHKAEIEKWTPVIRDAGIKVN